MSALRIYMYSLTALVIYLVKPGSSLFSWHPTLMTLGSMFMMYEAVVLFKPRKGLLDGKSYQTKINVHSFIQFLTLVVMGLGLTAVVTHKFNSNKPHFQSLHSILGGMACLLGFFQGIGGLATRFKFPSPLSQQSMKLGHTLNGMVVSFITSLAFVAGMFTNFMTEMTQPFIQILLISLPMIAFATSFTGLMNKMLKTILNRK